MITRFLKSYRAMVLLGFLIFSTFPMGCGAVGPPIPPEEVGIEAKVRKQQQQETQIEGSPSEDGISPNEEEGVELPNFYPIGTR